MKKNPCDVFSRIEQVFMKERACAAEASDCVHDCREKSA